MKILFLCLLSFSIFSSPPPCIEKDNAIYKNCSDQHKIFNEALERIKKIKRPLLIVLGFNECPWCKSLNKEFNNKNSVLQESLAKFEIIKIDSRTHSGKQIIETIYTKNQNEKVKKASFPSFVFISNQSDRYYLEVLEFVENNSKETKAHHYDKVKDIIESNYQKVK